MSVGYSWKEFANFPEKTKKKKTAKKSTRSTARLSSSEKTKNPAAVELGRLGGLKGGKSRAKKLSSQRRSEIARKAAIARWEKED